MNFIFFSNSLAGSGFHWKIGNGEFYRIALKIGLKTFQKKKKLKKHIQKNDFEIFKKNPKKRKNIRF